MAIGVTARASELLVFIASYMASHEGVAPSIGEMAEGIVAGRGHAHRLVRQLEERGHIVRLPNRARAIEVLEWPRTVPPLIDMRDPTRFEHLVWGIKDDGEKGLVPLAPDRNRE